MCIVLGKGFISSWVMVGSRASPGVLRMVDLGAGLSTT